MRRLRHRSAQPLVAGLLAGLLAACTAADEPPSTPAGTESGSSATRSDPGRPDAGGSPDAQPGSGPTSRVERLLRRVRVLPESPYHAGYDRGCGPGHACVFGTPWTDAHPGPFGRNGCDTRQDVLLQQMRDIEMRWGSRCRIYDARLVDPYSGESLTWRDDGYWIQVDHVYPLAAAWHAGAWAWSRQRRLRFANDVARELLAVGSRGNQEKGAATPATWLPPNREYRCRYLTRYLMVAHAYDLPVSRADADAIRVAARRC